MVGHHEDTADEPTVQSSREGPSSGVLLRHPSLQGEAFPQTRPPATTVTGPMCRQTALSTREKHAVSFSGPQQPQQPPSRRGPQPHCWKDPRASVLLAPAALLTARDLPCRSVMTGASGGDLQDRVGAEAKPPTPASRQTGPPAFTPGSAGCEPASSPTTGTAFPASLPAVM